MQHYGFGGDGRTKSSTMLLLTVTCLLFRAGLSLAAISTESVFNCDVPNNHPNFDGEESDMESPLCGGADNVTSSKSRREDAVKSCCDAKKTCERTSDTIHTSDYCHGILKYRQTTNHSAACDRSFTNLTGDGEEFNVESPLCGGADNVTSSKSRRQEFTNTRKGQQGTMDVLKSRREARKKFKLNSNTIQTSVPSDDIFKSQKNMPGVHQPPVPGASCNHSAANLTAVHGAASNRSVTNLTADGEEFNVESPLCGGADNVTSSKSRRQEFTNTRKGQQGTMDVLKSRREARKKFKLNSNTIQTSVPSDDIFKSQKNMPGVHQPPVPGASCNHSAANLTAVHGAASNRSVTNLTAVHGAACDHSLTNLTQGP